MYHTHISPYNTYAHMDTHIRILTMLSACATLA
jgi:hypothetical protein